MPFEVVFHKMFLTRQYLLYFSTFEKRALTFSEAARESTYFLIMPHQILQTGMKIGTVGHMLP